MGLTAALGLPFALAVPLTSLGKLGAALVVSLVAAAVAALVTGLRRKP